MLKISEEEKEKKKKGHPLITEGQRFIPYIVKLRRLPLVKSPNACLVVAQMEFLMGITKKQRFAKYLEPPKTMKKFYKAGQSWVEELGFSKDEFRTAFKQVGTVYNSKGEWMKADKDGDAFKGKYYLSFHHKPAHLTFYLRNSDLVNQELWDALTYSDEDEWDEEDSEFDEDELGF